MSCMGKNHPHGWGTGPTEGLDRAEHKLAMQLSDDRIFLSNLLREGFIKIQEQVK